ncbi:lysylphosphatidylglycerol synthase domain-containing protein [Thermococcus sp.]|uniref:lysylphosphatidylglycerol synthase domain-containing protein n=1 Tax=Thermococcus sp. TaxID=35749 RepID=UPI002633EB34|nr:lysylphosphatidylglycerol synthase domain-containing protein [Thermococcus sp.]
MDRETLKKTGVLVLTLGITAYLIHKVYAEASQIHLTTSQLRSPYSMLAVLLGVTGYLIYTATWYLYLSNVADVSYRRVLLANLSGTYLSFSLNAAIGTLIKVKFIGAKYFQVLATSLLEVSTEFLTGFTFIFITTRDPKALLVVAFFLLVFLADDKVYAAIMVIVRKLGRGDGVFKEFYDGWHCGKANPRRVALAMALGTTLVLVNAGILISVAKVFGVTIPLATAVAAILYSEFLGSALGTPGGVGGNELGVIMAIGNSGIDVVIAFFFKFINQYAFALVGAVAFYHFVSKEVEGKGINE